MIMIMLTIITILRIVIIVHPFLLHMKFPFPPSLMVNSLMFHVLMDFTWLGGEALQDAVASQEQAPHIGFHDKKHVDFVKKIYGFSW